MSNNVYKLSHMDYTYYKDGIDLELIDKWLNRELMMIEFTTYKYNIDAPLNLIKQFLQKIGD